MGATIPDMSRKVLGKARAGEAVSTQEARKEDRTETAKQHGKGLEAS